MDPPAKFQISQLRAIQSNDYHQEATGATWSNSTKSPFISSNIFSVDLSTHSIPSIPSNHYRPRDNIHLRILSTQSSIQRPPMSPGALTFRPKEPNNEFQHTRFLSPISSNTLPGQFEPGSISSDGEGEFLRRWRPGWQGASRRGVQPPIFIPSSLSISRREGADPVPPSLRRREGASGGSRRRWSEDF
ncbi:hypothetical protein NL676_034257 [Syzygium grande]|nr:hypothetical protein NL676_034257 [Syzygium grande]